MRIRSIHPEFWRSEDVGAMDWQTRLVFIGLWSYVDDNGVGRDNEKIIVADIFPLEDDPRDTLATVSRALQTLSAGGQITRYRVDGKAFLHINAWDQWQRIDRPGKARYPLPTSEDAEIATVSRQSRDTPATGEGEKGRRGEGSSAPNETAAESPKSTKSAASGAQTLALIEDTTPRLTAGLLVTAWCDGYKASTGKQPPQASVKRVAGSCSQIAKATPVTDVDAWRDAWQAARDAGKDKRLDVLGQLTDNGTRNRRPEKSASAFLDIANTLPDFDAIGA